MAPGKFGLFKARSREQEQPSTENLLHSSHSIEHVIPTSPVPSTSYGKTDQMSPVDFTTLQIDSDNEDLPSEQFTPIRRDSESSECEETQVKYHPLSMATTSNSTLHDDQLEDAGVDSLQDEDLEQHLRYSDQLDDGDASTSCDANSLQRKTSSQTPSESGRPGPHITNMVTIRPLLVKLLRHHKLPAHFQPLVGPVNPHQQNLGYRHPGPSGHRPRPQKFDATSLAVSEDLSVYCGTLKKGKRNRTKEERQLRDFDMWRASNVEVMQNLLSRSCTADDQIKWEAIATSRGLCTLTDNCTCGDCRRTKYLAGMTDGDGGLGTAPLFGAMSFGCTVQ